MYGRKTTKLLNMVRRFLGKEPSPASAPTGPGRGHRAEAGKDQDLARKVYTPVQQAKRIDQGVAGRAGYAYDAGRRPTSDTPSYTKRLGMLSASLTTNTTCRTSTSTMPVGNVLLTVTLWVG